MALRRRIEEGRKKGRGKVSLVAIVRMGGGIPHSTGSIRSTGGQGGG